MAKKKKLYAVYKNTNKDSEDYGYTFYSLASEGIKINDKIGSVECVHITDSLELAENMTVNTNIKE